MLLLTGSFQYTQKILSFHQIVFTKIFSDTFSNLLQEVLSSNSIQKMSSYPIIPLSEAALINLIEPSIDIDQLLVEGAVKGEKVSPSAPSSAHPALCSC